jgi:signal transduction histidine kinase
MTRRILVGFLAVLSAVIAAVVVPLGLTVTAQQRTDFATQAAAAARAISAIAEEHLDDKAPLSALRSVLSRFGSRGDGTVVLDVAGRTVARAGVSVPSGVLAAARTGAPLPRLPGRIAVRDRIGDSDRRLGVVVLVRDTAPVDHRERMLWASLAAAAAGALLLGAVVGWSLSRWIGRPLTSLIAAAQQMEHGDIAARADDTVGPRQVRDVAGAFNDMAARVTNLLDTQRGMTAEVSHQLRTPLAALRLRLELLAGELDEPPAAEVDAMIDEINRLARLVEGLLAVARAEATPPAPAPADLHSIAAARLAAWEPLATERGIDLRLDAEPVVVAATPGHLEQVIDNLLDNAIEATPPNGRIVVSVHRNGASTSLAVADTGRGMSADQREHGLDRFVTDRAGSGGTGLGLAVVTRLIAAAGGTTQLLETPGGGLTVEIRLPATRP